MAERCLMFSLSIVHIKCYVVLKMLVKTFVEPRARKCISSYHCKTALLHCTETTEAGFWRDDNLVQCVTRCLEMLRDWVTDGFCPHFILREENLFAGKVTVHNRGILRSILTDMIRSNDCVLQVRLDDLGQKLQEKLNTEPSVMPVLDTPATIGLTGLIELSLHETISSEIILVIFNHTSKEPIPLIQSVCQSIGKLKDRLRQSDKYERQAIQVFIEFFSCWLGSLLASVALSHNKRIPRKALQLFRNVTKFDVSATLKLASVLYCSGGLRKVEKILHSVEVHFSTNEIVPVCRCYAHRTSVSLEFCHVVYTVKGRKSRAKLFAHCVRFSPQEMICVPPALRHELHRSVGDDVQHRDPDEDRWMDLAVVDCLPYLYYLQYMTFRQLGKQDLQRRSLQNLDQCVREDHAICHLETIWNLLGQCHELELKPDAAMECYRTSLEIKPRNNAANRHVQNLRYACIRQNERLSQ